MARRAEAWSVTDRGGPIWYFKLAGWTSYRSTGIKVERAKGQPTAASRRAADDYARAQWDAEIQRRESAKRITLGEYADPFYDWARCPRIKRLTVDNPKAMTPSAWAMS